MVSPNDPRGDNMRQKGFVDKQYEKALQTINEQAEEIERLKQKAAKDHEVYVRFQRSAKWKATLAAFEGFLAGRTAPQTPKQAVDWAIDAGNRLVEAFDKEDR